MVISNAIANVTSVAPSSVRLGGDGMPRPTLPQQHHHQQDSAVTSRHGQHRLGNTIGSMVWPHHHQH
jgi:hypothetical protein